MRTAEQALTEMQDLRIRAAAWKRMQNEGGEGYNPYEIQILALSAELAEINRAAWTIEVTVARRAQWNDAVRAAAKSANCAALQAKCGFLLADLKDAIKRHGL
jgi:hypothetical protein